MFYEERPNLNMLSVEVRDPDEDGHHYMDECRPSFYASVAESRVEAFFGPLEIFLAKKIREYDGVVGCLAWITNGKVLKELSKKKIVSIVVQKEDFLRPDYGVSYKNVRKLYRSLPVCNRSEVGIFGLSTAGDQSMEAVRCMGVASSDKVSPRMHHKFLVFGSVHSGDPHDPADIDSFIPEAVWTGSYNPTINANSSIENAVMVHSQELAEFYHNEYKWVASLSEPLDWDSPYVSPQWRIGT